jgi:L-alanine-DL-glutamate epimerase-like enolase superfamily enzyme
VKITKVDAFPLATPREENLSGHLPYEEHLAGIAGAGYYSTLVKITTDEAVVGWGDRL